MQRQYSAEFEGETFVIRELSVADIEQVADMLPDSLDPIKLMRREQRELRKMALVSVGGRSVHDAPGGRDGVYYALKQRQVEFLGQMYDQVHRAPSSAAEPALKAMTALES